MSNGSVDKIEQVHGMVVRKLLEHPRLHLTATNVNVSFTPDKLDDGQSGWRITVCLVDRCDFCRMIKGTNSTCAGDAELWSDAFGKLEEDLERSLSTMEAQLDAGQEEEGEA